MSRFVVQLHDATRLHYDLRLELGGVLRSWAVPRGPSLDPAVRRLAVQVEDHSLESGEFEGVHEGQARGTGAVIIWDEGGFELRRDEPAHLSFVLDGHKLAGRFGLLHTGGRQWLLVKADDEGARRGSDVAAEQPWSVRTGRTWQEVAMEHERTSDVDDPGPFFHGTKADLAPGDVLTPGRRSNFGSRRDAAYVYLTATMDAATWGAELAVGDGPGRIYEVEPTGPIEDDPNLTDQRFPGNPTRSYRTRSSLRVVREIVGWEPHPPEVLQAMRDHLAELDRQGIEAIED